MRFFRHAITASLALSIALATLGGCDTMKKNPRTTGTIAGGATGAAIGAAVDKEHPAEGAVIGGAVGAGAGNYGGKVYKDRHD